MRLRVLSVVLFTLAATSLPAASIIRIGGLKLYLISVATDSPDRLREYLPRSEDPDHWTRRATVQVFKDRTDPVAYLKQAAADVMKTGRFAHYQVVNDPVTKEVILDFMTFPPNTDAEQYAEWSLLRARLVPGRGLVVCQYSMRSYVVGSPAAVKVRAERARMTEPFKAATFEEEAAP